MQHKRLSLGVLGVMALSPFGCSRLDDLWSASTLRPADVALPSEPGDVSERATDAQRVDSPAPSVPEDAAAPYQDATTDARVDSGPDNRPTITALAIRTGVVEAPQSNAHWIGYLRAGARVSITAGPVGNVGCPARRDVPGGGWYQIDGGGFVCVGPFASLTPNVDPRTIARRLLSQADRDASLPYQYAINYRPAVMYRWLPSEEDERAIEPERFTPRVPVVSPPTSVAAAALDAGPTVDARPTPVAGPITATTDAGLTVASNPDAGVRIEDLEGAAGSPLLRRLLRGMYVSLDRQVSAPRGSFWHTQSGGYLRAGAVSMLSNPPSFHGTVLDASHQLPVAFVISTVATSFQPSGGAMAAVGAPLERLRMFHLSAEPPTRVRGEFYYHTAEGFFLRARQVRVVEAHAPPTDLLPDESWIDVNLDHQSVVAYEGTRAVYVTVGSTGRRNRTDPDANYETVQGSFRIQSKHVATTMDGNSANDGPYSIEDVPWVMYFEQSFALHGAFWHRQFGTVHSHGCVNLSPPDAHWLFDWSGPHVPAGWQGVESTPANPGTRVFVHYDSQALGERGGPIHPPPH